MFDILISVWQGMESYEFFYYVPALAGVGGLFAIFKSFFGRGVKI